MRRYVVYLCIIFGIFVPNATALSGAYGSKLVALMERNIQIITPMEALDQVKELYAANFDKVYTKTNGEYYYKLPFADYYLVYEGKGETEKEYVFHLYEFVLDEPDTGIGHTVTYGWYKVDHEGREITDQTQ